MALPKSVCDNCINSECLWRAPTGGNDPPVMVCPNKIEKPQTNADRIRTMTDEELADWIIGVIQHGGVIPYGGTGVTLDWLKQEVDNVELD